MPPTRPPQTRHRAAIPLIVLSTCQRVVLSPQWSGDYWDSDRHPKAPIRHGRSPHALHAQKSKTPTLTPVGANHKAHLAAAGRGLSSPPRHEVGSAEGDGNQEMTRANRIPAVHQRPHTRAESTGSCTLKYRRRDQQASLDRGGQGESQSQITKD